MGSISHRDSRNEFQFTYAAECAGANGEMPPQTPVEGDYFGGVFDYIKQMLMDEDDLDHRPCMFQDCSALQAAETYFRDALSHGASPPPQSVYDPLVGRDWNFDFTGSPGFPPLSVSDSDIVATPSTISCDFDWLASSADSLPLAVDSIVSSGVQNKGTVQDFSGQDSRNFQLLGGEATTDLQNCTDSDEQVNRTRGRGDGGEREEERSTKQFAAAYAEESVQMEKYDRSLLCPKLNPRFYDDSPPSLDDDSPETSDSEEESKKQYRKTKEVKRGRPKGTKKNRKVNQVMDLSSLLTRCAEAVSAYNVAAAANLLKQIRDHSSPLGDPNERLAHCFANALEARMNATGSALYTASSSRRIPAAQLLKSYQTYVTACPFKRMSNIFANKSIAKIAREATKLHIIDFGILYGFQWPCIIQGLSLKPGGPPMLKITGIDYPQPGFKPAERAGRPDRAAPHRLLQEIQRPFPVQGHRQEVGGRVLGRAGDRRRRDGGGQLPVPAEARRRRVRRREQPARRGAEADKEDKARDVRPRRGERELQRILLRHQVQGGAVPLLVAVRHDGGDAAAGGRGPPPLREGGVRAGRDERCRVRRGGEGGAARHVQAVADKEQTGRVRADASEQGDRGGGEGEGEIGLS